MRGSAPITAALGPSRTASRQDAGHGARRTNRRAASRIPIRGGTCELKTIGRHLIAEYYGCDLELIDSVDAVAYHMQQAAELIGATVLGTSFHRFAPQGVSGTVVISESHLSIHTWPENGYVAVDIYTCGGLDPRPGFEYLASELASQSLRVQEILRGVPEDLDDHKLLVPEDVEVMTRWVEAQPAPGCEVG